MKNWPIDDDGQAVTATATSAAILLTDRNALVAEDVMIDNPGPIDVFVRAGVAGVVATTLSVRVPAGSLQPYRKGQGMTHLALVCKGGQSQAVVVHVGDGQ